MAINWQKLEDDIRTYLESGKNDKTGKSYSIKNSAKIIELLYITEIKKNATDIFMNPVLSITVNESTGLHKSLEAGFNSSFKTGKINLLNQRGTEGLLQHWSGAQFSPLIPVLPVMSVGINNTVTSSGNIIPMNLYGVSKSKDLFAVEIVKALKIHAGTIGGLFTGINSTGGPIAIPWLGII